jgi:adenylate cyclase
MCGIVVEQVARVSALWSEDRAAEIAAAEAIARRAQALDPKNPEVRFAVGFLRRIQMRFDEAIVEFMAVLRDNPNHAGAHADLGWALAFTGRDREAIEHFTEAIRRSPRDPFLFLGYFGIGYVRYEMRDYEAALAALREAIALGPHFSWAHLILTASQSALGRETEARDALASYFRTNPAVKTIAGLRANPVSPRLAGDDNSFYVALRAAGMPEV